jgi:hypothetical protein
LPPISVDNCRPLLVNPRSVVPPTEYRAGATHRIVKETILFIAKFSVFALPLLVALVALVWPMSRIRVGIQKVASLQGVEIPLSLVVFLKGIVAAGCLLASFIIMKVFFPTWL